MPAAIGTLMRAACILALRPRPRAVVEHEALASAIAVERRPSEAMPLGTGRGRGRSPPTTRTHNPLVSLDVFERTGFLKHSLAWGRPAGTRAVSV